MCVCVCVCIDIDDIDMDDIPTEARANPSVSSSVIIMFFLKQSPFAEPRAGLVDQQQRSSCLHLPTTGITRTQHHAWLSLHGSGDQTQVFILVQRAPLLTQPSL